MLPAASGATVIAGAFSHVSSALLPEPLWTTPSISTSYPVPGAPEAPGSTDSTYSPAPMSRLRSTPSCLRPPVTEATSTIPPPVTR